MSLNIPAPSQCSSTFTSWNVTLMLAGIQTWWDHLICVQSQETAPVPRHTQAHLRLCHDSLSSSQGNLILPSTTGIVWRWQALPSQLDHGLRLNIQDFPQEGVALALDTSWYTAKPELSHCSLNRHHSSCSSSITPQCAAFSSAAAPMEKFLWARLCVLRDLALGFRLSYRPPIRGAWPSQFTAHLEATLKWRDCS